MCVRSLVLVVVIVVAGAVPAGGVASTGGTVPATGSAPAGGTIPERSTGNVHPEENQPPLVDAGLDQTATVGSTVYLDGGGSLDPDGEIVEFRWEIERPDGSKTTPAKPSDPTTRFSPTAVGEYEITLSATDDDGATRRDTVYVTVGPAPTPTDTETATETQTPEETPTPSSGTDTNGPEETTQTPTDRGTGSAPSGIDGEGGVTGDSETSPEGRIVGSDTVASGTTASFSVDAYDPDGEIVSYEWSFDAEGERATKTFADGSGREVTFSVLVIDDDGLSTSLSKTVFVENTSEPNSLPVVEMVGDTILTAGERATFTLVGRDPDGAVTQYHWSQPVETTGATLNQTFSEPGNYTLRAAAEGDEGRLTWVTKQVRVLPRESSTDEPPVVSLTGPETAPSGSTQKYEVEARDPDGGPVVVQWSPTVTTGETELQPGQSPKPTDSTVVSVPLSGEVGSVQTITATVTDDEGNEVTVHRRTRLTAVTREAPDQDDRPTVGDFGIEYDPDDPTQTGDTDVIRGKYELGVEVFHAGGEDVTVTWNLGDGTVKTQTFESLDGSRTASISHTFLSDGGGTKTYEITAEVTDQSGNTQRFTTTQTVTTLATADAIQFSASSGGTSVAEGGELRIRPDDDVRFDVWSYQPFEIEPGDGTIYSGSGSTRTASLSHRYSNPGRYVALVTSVQGSSGVGAARVVVIVERETYTEYHYQQEVTETEETVAASEPSGDGWNRGDVDRTEETLTGETRSVEAGTRAQAPSSSDPSTTWVRQRTYEESEQYLATRVASDSPGSDWWIESRRWSTKTVTSTSTTTQWRESRLSFSRTWTLVGQRTETSTERTESTSDPGRGWSKSGDTGDVKLTGYESTWYDQKGDHGNAWYTGWKKCVREVSVAGRQVCVDHEYKYTYPDYDTVYEWTKSTTDTDYKYEKETQTTETVWQHKWGKTKTRSVSYVEYEKQTSTTYWKWSRERTVGGDWVWKLVEPESDEYISGTLEQFERHCDSDDGHFQEEKCD